MSAEAPWLPLGAGPEPRALAERVAWWRAREEALRRAPAGLRALALPPAPEPGGGAAPPRALPAGVHAELEPWLPWALLRRELQALLAGWFQPAVLSGEVALDQGELARARSWVDARRRLRTLRQVPGPAALLESLAAPDLAWRLLCEDAAPPAQGAALGRYSARLSALAARLAPAGRVRAWDVGAASGEGTWELAAALLEAGAGQVEVQGSDTGPLLVGMAARAARPHDPRATTALRAFLAARPALRDPARVRVSFVRHDVRQGPLGAGLDLVTCHGLLGEGLATRQDAAAALVACAAALRPGGLLSLADRFRQDRARAAREWTRELAPGLGLTPTGEAGVWEKADRT